MVDLEELVELLDLPAELAVLLVAALPVVELRGAIPLGMSVYELSPLRCFLLGLIGNAFSAAVLFRYFDPLMAELRARSSLLDRTLGWLLERTQRDVGARYERYGAVALAALVLFGSWKAVAAAALFDVRSRYAVPAIGGGLVASGIVVTLLTLGIVS